MWLLDALHPYLFFKNCCVHFFWIHFVDQICLLNWSQITERLSFTYLKVPKLLTIDRHVPSYDVPSDIKYQWCEERERLIRWYRRLKYSCSSHELTSHLVPYSPFGRVFQFLMGRKNCSHINRFFIWTKNRSFFHSEINYN